MSLFVHVSVPIMTSGAVVSINTSSSAALFLIDWKLVMIVRSPLRWWLGITLELLVFGEDVRSGLQIDDDVVLSNEWLLQSDNKENELLLNGTSYKVVEWLQLLQLVQNQEVGTVS